jgi:Phage capsid family
MSRACRIQGAGAALARRSGYCGSRRQFFIEASKMRPLVPEDLPRNAAIMRDATLNSFTRAVIATGISKLEGRGGVTASDYAGRRWPNDNAIDMVLRASVAPATIGTSGPIAVVTQQFFSTLVGVYAGASLLGRGIQLNFGGAAQINMPGIAIPTADFVGEGAPIPAVTAPTNAGASLVPHKLAVITELTNEILRASNAENIVRQVMTESTGPALDKALFSNTAGDAIRPAGLLNGLTPLTPAPAGTKDQAMADDLIALTAPLMRVAAGPVVIVAAPEQALAMALRAFRDVPAATILASAALTAGTVIAVNPAALVSATEGVPQIDNSPNVTIHEDTAPLALNASGTPAYPTRSVFQSDTIGLRLRWRLTWARRAANAVQFMNSVTW